MYYGSSQSGADSNQETGKKRHQEFFLNIKIYYYATFFPEFGWIKNKQTLFSKEDQRDVKEKIIGLNFLRSSLHNKNKEDNIKWKYLFQMILTEKEGYTD